MFRQMYSLAFLLATPLLLTRLLWRAKKAPAYARRVHERFAFGNVMPAKLSQGSSVARDTLVKQVIWLHAVSVGEVMAGAPIVDRLLQKYGDEYWVLVTTMTPTGSERVVDRWGGRVLHCYAPYDCAWTMRRFMKKLHPKLLVIMETELWPNMIHYASKAGCEIILVNARLSAKSAKGYQKILPMVKPMMQSLSTVAVQSQVEGDRFIELGLPASALVHTGSVKFDVLIDDSLMSEGRRVRAALNRPIWIAASTHPGENEVVLRAFKRLRAMMSSERACLKAGQGQPLLIIVPRHPECFELVYQLSLEAGWVVARRTDQMLPNGDTDVFIGDTMGELMRFYAMSHVAFVGGSLIARGGHNVLEPIAAGLPVVVGPHMFNFQFIYDALSSASGISTALEEQQLAESVMELFLNSKEQRVNAEVILEANRGALRRVNEIIDVAITKAQMPLTH